MFAYGPADATVRLFLPIWYRLTQVVLEKRPFKGCSGSSGLSLIVIHYVCVCGFIAFSVNCLQCFDAVGWAAGMTSGL